jgi:hypothetical protein
MKHERNHMSEEKRNGFGYIVPPDPPFARMGENTNPKEYADGKGKTNPPPGGITLNEDGTQKYAVDGVTTDWWATHPRPVTRKP